MKMPAPRRHSMLRSLLLGSLGIAAAHGGTTDDQSSYSSGDGKPAITHEITGTYSYTPDEGIHDGFGRRADIQVDYFSINYLMTARISEGTTLLAGAFSSVADIETTQPIFLPSHLETFGLTLGAVQSLDGLLGPAWHAKVVLRPGFASDSSDISGSDFNLQGTASLMYQASSTLSWELGAVLNVEGDTPVLPLAGLKWQFAPEWTLGLGFPQTGIAWQATEDVTLRAGATFQGGTYHVSWTRAGRVPDSWMDYREIRAGLGIDYAIVPNITLSLDGGMVLDRKFDYFDDHYKVEGDDAPFVTAGIKARF